MYLRLQITMFEVFKNSPNNAYIKQYDCYDKNGV